MEFNIYKITPHLLIDGSIEFCINLGKDKRALSSLEEINALLSNKKDVVCKIEPKKRKRSLDSNAYFWKMADLLSRKMSESCGKTVTKEDIYREYIKDIPGENEILPIRNDAVEKFISSWKGKGVGWVCERLGESKIPGYTNVIAYYGSSCFSTKSMSILIDMVISDCKEFGIETKTPDEIESMLQLEKSLRKDY